MGEGWKLPWSPPACHPLSTLLSMFTNTEAHQTVLFKGFYHYVGMINYKQNP